MLMAMVLWGLGCGVGWSGDPSQDPGEVPTGFGPCTTSTVRPSGGVIWHDDGRLTVPAGALAEIQEISLCAVEEPLPGVVVSQTCPWGLPMPSGLHR